MNLPTPEFKLTPKLMRSAESFAAQQEFVEVVRLEAGQIDDNRLPQLFVSLAKPVIVSGYLAGSRLKELAFEQIRERAGNFLLDPSQKPSLVVRNYQRWVTSAAPMLLADYLDRMLNPCEKTKDDLYEHYRNLRIAPDFREALRLVRPLFLDESEVNPPCIWIGRQGSSTGLHTDPNDNFVVNAIGVKRFYLFAPCDLPNLYLQQVGQTSFLRSPVDPRSPIPGQYPLYSRARCVTAELRRGDLLFLPLGWAHFVECLEHSFTYNYWLREDRTPYFERGAECEVPGPPNA